MLADYRFGMNRIGVTVNVEPGTEVYERFKAYANLASIVIANNKIALSNFSPLTATGEELTTLAGIFGVTRRSASSAAGKITARARNISSITIPSGFICTSAAGLKYATTSAVTSSATVFTLEVRAQTGGDATNLDPGALLTWDDASIGPLKLQAFVGVYDSTTQTYAGDISGGADEDDDEKLRERLIERLSFPAVGGNWSQAVQLAELSSASIEKAFAYPCVRGPGSYDIAIIKAGGNRTLTTDDINTAASAVTSQMPGHADLNLTSVSEMGVDVVINLSLPLPASGGGSGGGWRDAVPWPSTTESGGNGKPKITAVNVNTSTITVNSTDDIPVAGKHFGVWISTLQEMREYTILSVGGVSGARTIVIDVGTSDSMSGLAAGQYVSAGAFNLKAYAATFLEAMDKLGPGEKTTSTDILPRGARKPPPDVSYPASLTLEQLAALKNNHVEVLDAQYGGRFSNGTTIGLSTPSPPATTADPPRILTLKQLSLRCQN